MYEFIQGALINIQRRQMKLIKIQKLKITWFFFFFFCLVWECRISRRRRRWNPWSSTFHAEGAVWAEVFFYPAPSGQMGQRTTLSLMCYTLLGSPLSSAGEGCLNFPVVWLLLGWQWSGLGFFWSVPTTLHLTSPDTAADPQQHSTSFFLRKWTPKSISC